jgi:hypothetical protein
VACARKLVDSELRRLGRSAYSGRPVAVSGPDAIRRCFFHGNRIGEPTAVLFRKSQSGRGFNEDYSQVFDLEMWFRLLEQGSFAFIPDELCRIRQHGAQGTQGNFGAGKITADRQRLFREFAPKPYIRAGWSERLLWDLRMAWLLCRDSGARGDVIAAGVAEAVFFPKLLYPLFWAALRIGALRAALRRP